MDEYYSTWQHSSHRNVACIDCHYEPGAAAVVEGKVAGLVQVVKYVSHSYGTKPHALISDASCMRPGCHAGMDQAAEEMAFNGRIKFRHDKHLASTALGTELKCVSCHGHTDKAEHVNVAESACVTCHFYGREDKAVASGDCSTCHSLPAEAVTFMGQKFEHVSFLHDKTSVRCEHCHSQVTRGEGAVSAVRCRSCHVGKSLVEEADRRQLHLVHVSDQNIDCLQCHDEIDHGISPKEQPRLASGDCKTCHAGQRHSLQERMYAGRAIPARKVQADPMYKAHVACNGCHTDPRSEGAGEMAFTMEGAGPTQCVDCHGNQRYGRMLENWQKDTRDRVGQFQADLAKLDKACSDAKDAPPDQVAKARAMLEAMRATLTCIEKDGSYGAHNYPYVSDALDDMEDELDDCRELTGGWKLAARSR